MTPEQTLIALYRRTARRLRAQIAADLKDKRIGTAVYRARQVQAIDAELRKLGQRTRTMPVDVVMRGYDRGAALVDVVAGRATIKQALQARYAFSGTHVRAPRILADNLARSLGEARVTLGRQAEDVYRSAALDEIAEGIIAGDTRRDVSRRLEERLIRQGVTGFVARNGAHWQLDTYVEMVTRTTTREAMTAGTEERMRETGQDLVTVSDHATETDICKEFEGGTYSLTGETEGYELLPARPPFHPRCLHYLTPAADNLERTMAALGLTVPAGAG